MRSLVFDEISAPDMARLKEALDQRLEPSGLAGEVYWYNLPEGMLSARQREHQEQCGPHRVAIVLEQDAMRLELLIRAEGKMRCSCVEYADAQQREQLFRYLDRLINQLGLST